MRTKINYLPPALPTQHTSTHLARAETMDTRMSQGKAPNAGVLFFCRMWHGWLYINRSHLKIFHVSSEGVVSNRFVDDSTRGL